MSIKMDTQKYKTATKGVIGLLLIAVTLYGLYQTYQWHREGYKSYTVVEINDNQSSIRLQQYGGTRQETLTFNTNCPTCSENFFSLANGKTAVLNYFRKLAHHDDETHQKLEYQNYQ